MISRKEILMGRDRDYPLSPEQDKNLDQLLTAINIIRAAYGKPMLVSSGYRPGHFNKQAKGAKQSAHMTCQAVDISDPDKTFSQWCLDNLNLLVSAGLYLENPAFTPTWTHLQTRPTKNRVFNP